MKVLFLSSSDGRGGAFAAAFRLLKGLEGENLSAQMLVAENTRNDPSVIGPASRWARGVSLLRPFLDTFPLKAYRKREPTFFSTAYLPDGLATKVALINPDIIHLHWVCGGFLRIETLKKLRKPIVWTLHDMWAFSGGCHYAGSCERFKDACGECPQLNSKEKNDLSHRILNRKMRAWRDADITIVSPSRWLADCAKASFLFRNRYVEVIPNGIDIERYKPIDKRVAREILNLPQDRKLILFGAVNAMTDRRKGFQYLEPAFRKLSMNGREDKLELIIFGAVEPANPPNLGLKTHYVGALQDDTSLALLYSSADVFVLPSIQENLPNTVSEALACGVPVVAFNVGGIPDMVKHQVNGYVAWRGNTDDFAHGIQWVLSELEKSPGLKKAARDQAEKEYALTTQAGHYLKLYRTLMERQKARKILDQGI